ncbi:MAG: helix-turn-helix transcriptional regulator [Saprospiraceae bacterium]|nr:helix-turn-helix transcriptional regulator [Saprospiraceae bacterium]
MKITFWKSPDQRQHTRASFALSASSDKNVHTLVVPDGTVGILRVLEGQFSRTSKGKTTTFKKGDLILFGQKTHAVEYLPSTENFKAVGVKLLPEIIYRKYLVNAKELTDEYALVKDLPKRPRPQRVWQDEKSNRALVKSMQQAIVHARGMARIDSLCKDLNVSYKRMERLFARYVGLSPKQYARLIRFNYSILEAMDPENNLTDTAYQCGYCDQNHFIKEFKNFTSCTPSQILSHGLDHELLAYLKNRLHAASSSDR